MSQNRPQTWQERQDAHDAAVLRVATMKQKGPKIAWLLVAVGIAGLVISKQCEPDSFAEGFFAFGLGVMGLGSGGFFLIGLSLINPRNPEWMQRRGRKLLLDIGFDATIPDAPPPLPDIHGNARWATPQELEKRGMLVDPDDAEEGAKRIILGVDDSGKLVTHNSPTGIITVGSPGTGKFLTSIALNLFNWLFGSCWVFDPKGEIAAVTARFRALFSRVIVINPFGVLYTTPEEQARYPHMKPMGFDLFGRLHGATDFDDVAATIAARLVQNENGRDDFWLQGARGLMAGIIAYLFHAETAVDLKERPFPKTLLGIQAFLQLPPDMLTAHARMAMLDERECMYLARDGLVEWATACGDPPKPGSKNADPKGREWPKSTLETLFTLRRQLGELLRSSGIRQTLSGSDFQWSDLRREKCSVYIVLPADKVERFERFTTLLLDDALETLAAPPRPGDQPVYMVLDEVATALHKRMKWIGRAYALARGQRFIIHSYFQNWSQVRSAFPNPGEIVGAAGSIQFYRNQDPETYEVLRKYGGRFTEWLHMVGENHGFSVNEQTFGQREVRHTSDGQSFNWQHHPQDLIKPELVREDLDSPSAENGYVAKQIIIVDGLAVPVQTSRAAYFRLNPAWGRYHNPYAPVGPHNPPPPPVEVVPEPPAPGRPSNRPPVNTVPLHEPEPGRPYE